jgi:hypothetical protein
MSKESPTSSHHIPKDTELTGFVAGVCGQKSEIQVASHITEAGRTECPISVLPIAHDSQFSKLSPLGADAFFSRVARCPPYLDGGQRAMVFLHTFVSHVRRQVWLRF